MTVATSDDKIDRLIEAIRLLTPEEGTDLKQKIAEKFDIRSILPAPLEERCQASQE